MLKISLLFKKIINFRANNSTILRFNDAKLSGYCYYINTNIEWDFQICINVPLIPLPLRQATVNLLDMMQITAFILVKVRDYKTLTCCSQQ